MNPIDIIRTQEAAQIKHIENHRMQSAQDQEGKNFQNTIVQDQFKPTQMTKTDNDEYRYDAKQKGNNEYKDSGKKKNKNDKEDKKDPKKQQKNGGIDILI